MVGFARVSYLMNGDLRACFRALPRNLRLHWLALLPILSLMAVMEMVAAVVVYRLVGRFSNAATSSVTNLVAIAAAVFILRSVCAGVVATWQVRVVARSMQSAFASLVEGVLRDGLTASSSAVIQDAASGVDIVYRRVFGSAAMMVAEAVTVAAIGSVLVAKAPGAALLLLAITGVAVLALIALTRRVAYRTGDEQYQSEQDRVASLLQIIGGMREIRAFGLDARFRGASEQIAERHHRAFVRYGLLTSMPRIAIEMLFVLTALAMTALLTAHAGANDLPALALFAYAAFRLIPSVNRILFLTEEVRHGRRAATSLASSLRTRALAPLPAVPDGDDLLVQLRDVSVFFGEMGALHHVDFEVARGEAVAITGLSGAGKTTLLDVIAGAIPPTTGELRRADVRIAYLTQRPFLFEGSIAENIALHSPAVDDERLRRMANAAQLADGRPLTDAADALSEGERQRAGLARALYAEPELLLLDEPTSALDIAAEQGVIDALRTWIAAGGTLILTSHHQELISICTRVIAIEHGTLRDRETQTQRMSAV